MASEEIARDDRRFENVFERLSGLEQEAAETRTWRGRVDMDLYNHGRDGLKTQFTAFVAAFNASAAKDEEARKLEKAERARMEAEREKKRERIEKRRDRNIAIIGIVVSILTLVLGWMGYLETLHHISQGDLHMPKISGVNNLDPVYAEDKRTQDVQIPPTFERAIP